MTETGAGITGNDELTSLRDFLRGHFDHLDNGVHDLQQRAERIEAHLVALQADLDAARPLLDKFKNSGIARLATGRMPWD